MAYAQYLMMSTVARIVFEMMLDVMPFCPGAPCRLITEHKPFAAWCILDVSVATVGQSEECF